MVLHRWHFLSDLGILNGESVANLNAYLPELLWSRVYNCRTLLEIRKVFIILTIYLMWKDIPYFLNAKLHVAVINGWKYEFDMICEYWWVHCILILQFWKNLDYLITRGISTGVCILCGVLIWKSCVDNEKARIKTTREA